MQVKKNSNDLTDKQVKIIGLLLQDKSCKQITVILGYKPKSTYARKNIERLRKQFKVKTTHGLILELIKLKLIY